MSGNFTQAKTDLVKIIRATSENKLKNIKISWKNKKYDNRFMFKGLSK